MDFKEKNALNVALFKADKIKKVGKSIINTRPQNTNNVKINTLPLKTPRKVPCVKRKVICGMVKPSVSMCYGGGVF